MSLLDDDRRGRLEHLLSAPEDRFDKLIQIAGIDPTRDLRFADLREVDFGSCLMIGWDFTGADLRGASFRDAKLSKCTFTNAIGMDLSGATELNPSSAMPSEGRTAVAPEWDDVRTFLEVARNGSFRATSERLGMSIGQLRSRIDRLERQMGAMLLTRHVDGVRLTDEGRTILDAAARMEAASGGLILGARSNPSLSGEVRIAMTESIGGFWLIPELIKRKREFPKLLLDFRCAPRSADVLRLEADACVQLQRPTSPDLKLVKAGRIHSLLFASSTYLDTYGTPAAIQDVLKHSLVLEIGAEANWQEYYDRLFPGIPQSGFVTLRNNTTINHYLSIASGAGLGWLPSYASVFASNFDQPIIPIAIPKAIFAFDVWLVYHPDAARIPRVRRAIDWIIDAFDPRKYPWFRDEFIHPNEFEKEMRNIRQSWNINFTPTTITDASGRSHLEQPASESLYKEVSHTVEAIKARTG